MNTDSSIVDTLYFSDFTKNIRAGANHTYEIITTETKLSPIYSTPVYSSSIYVPPTYTLETIDTIDTIDTDYHYSEILTSVLLILLFSFIIFISVRYYINHRTYVYRTRLHNYPYYKTYRLYNHSYHKPHRRIVKRTIRRQISRY